jgi:hypothetical protein
LVEARGWADQGVGRLFTLAVAPPDLGEEEVLCSTFRGLILVGILLLFNGEADDDDVIPPPDPELGVCERDLVGLDNTSVVFPILLVLLLELLLELELEELEDADETGVCDLLLGVPFFNLGVGT